MPSSVVTTRCIQELILLELANFSLNDEKHIKPGKDPAISQRRQFQAFVDQMLKQVEEQFEERMEIDNAQEQLAKPAEQPKCTFMFVGRLRKTHEQNEQIVTTHWTVSFRKKTCEISVQPNLHMCQNLV